MYSHFEPTALNLAPERLSGQTLAQLALALFDEIECGLIVCDEHGAIHFANQAAKQEMSSQRLLMLLGEKLRRANGCGGELDTALRLAAQRSRRSLVRMTQGGDQLMVSVLPFQLPGTDAQQVLVVLGRRQPCSDLGLEMLAGSYGLTLAERRVLGGLVRQATPREIASANAVKLSTVRTQISSIRAKFGTRSIEGLLLRAAQVPPVASALRLASMSPAATAAALPVAPMLAAA
jgi:DNA-binding CsgD family transcriptional regulator